MEAIVLAGGFGTRLSKVITDVPKPMAPMCGRPFLEYVLDALIIEGVNRIILAVGYKKECIMEHFGTSYHDVSILYSVEEKPLYTGGAVKQALQTCTEDRVFIVNGDTYFPVQLRKMRCFSLASNVAVVLAVKRMYDFSRYGDVDYDQEQFVTAFHEKRFCTRGFINGGIYDFARTALSNCPDVFSLEKDYFPMLIGQREIKVFPNESSFIDIGIPEDYERAQKLLK